MARAVTYSGAGLETFRTGGASIFCWPRAVYGEEAGFDSVWLEEHHSIRNHYWPSPLLALAGIASRTSRLLLGTDIVVLPFYHPVRAAEDAAMLDVISNGRAIFGAAIGYRPPEFELYGVNLEDRGARYVEMLKIIRALWTQDVVDFAGRFYKIKGTIEPKPARPIPIWLGGWGDLSLKRTADLGDAWVPGPTANLEKLLAAQTQYRTALVDAGKDPAAAGTTWHPGGAGDAAHHSGLSRFLQALRPGSGRGRRLFPG